MKTPQLISIVFMLFMFLSACTFNANVSGLGGNSSSVHSPSPTLPPDDGVFQQKIFVDITQVTLTEGSVAIINVAVNPVRDQDTIVTLSLNSSALSVVRFNPIPSQIIIPAGSTSKSIVLNTIDDSLMQDQELWNFSISSNDSTIQADPGVLAITLNDNDGGNIPNAPSGPPIPKLLKEFNPYPTNVNKISFNNKIVYVGSDASHGAELWITDGSVNGTKLIKDIEPGVNSSSPSGFYVDSTNQYVYFLATTSSEGTELWRTDGSEAGTLLIKDLEPGVGTSNPTIFYSAAGKVYFRAQTTLEGYKPYVTDGTYSGTHRLITSTPADASYVLYSATTYNGEVVMSIENSVDYRFEIWKTNGTEAGTSAIVTQATGPEVFSNGLTLEREWGGKLYFQGYGVNGKEPYVTQGTNATTVILKNLYLFNLSSYATSTPYVLGGKLVITYTYDDTPSSGNGYYLTDGTPANTVKVLQPVKVASPMGKIGGNLIFNGCSTTECELYSTAGVDNDAIQIKDINPGASASSQPTFVAQIGTKIFFTATDATNGTELWVTDGSLGGTVLLKDIFPGATSSSILEPTVMGNNLVFRAQSPSFGEELWISDGTPSGTVLFKDLVPGVSGSGPRSLAKIDNDHLFFTAFNSATGLASVFFADLTAHSVEGVPHAMVETLNSETKNLVEMGGLVYFDAMDKNSGNPLWVTNGTLAGTTKIIDLYPNIGCSDISSITVMNSSLFFVASQEATGSELHISNGTTAGTQHLIDLAPGTTGSFAGTLAKTDFGKIFFSATPDLNVGTELYVSDGTAIGTGLVKNIASTAASSSYPTSIVPLPGHNRVMFYTLNPAAFHVSDGTLAGTTQLSPTGIFIPGLIWPTSAGAFLSYFDSSSRIRIFYYNATTQGVTDITTTYTTDLVLGYFNYNPTLNVIFYVTATTAYTSINLWKSDGTVAGTSIVKNIPISGNNFGISHFGNLDGKSFFYYRNDTTTAIRQLWATDGTLAGTVKLDDVTVTNNSLFLTSGIVYNGYYYYGRPSDSTGIELWKTDGTLANTMMVKDINPGTASSSPSLFTIYNGKLYFVATDATSGRELWRTDGTLLGTELVHDINPGVISSNPSKLSVLAGKLYFIANKVLSGVEVWVYSE